MAIICAHCGQENPDGVRMCGVCGSTLVVERAAKSYLGDPTGAEDQQRALDLAIELRSSIAGSIANNISVIAFFAAPLRS